MAQLYRKFLRQVSLSSAIHSPSKVLIFFAAFNAFLPLLEKNRQNIQSVRRETMKYGNTQRHMVSGVPILTARKYWLTSHVQLDVYYPPTSTDIKPPILIFAYGGGFTSGDRIRPPPADLVYACVGAFFASRGLLTVIPDYRLLPEIKYPQPVEDVRDALVFAVQHLGDAGDTDKIFLYGHSAGASIMTSMFLHEPALLVDADVLKRVKGVVSLGAPVRVRGACDADDLAVLRGCLRTALSVWLAEERVEGDAGVVAPALRNAL